MLYNTSVTMYNGSLIPLTCCRGAASATDLTASNRCKSSGFGARACG